YLVVLIIIIMLTFHYIAERTGVHAFRLDGDNPKLPESLARSKHKIVFIGPPGSAMRSLGDKISSTIAANVPTMDWSAFAQVQGEVPGSPTFIMRLAPDARHLEVQIIEALVTIAKEETVESMERAAVRLAKLVGY
ncbi:16590_t:CDS:2, partial [Funneliformis geosporum]